MAKQLAAAFKVLQYTIIDWPPQLNKKLIIDLWFLPLKYEDLCFSVLVGQKKTFFFLNFDFDLHFSLFSDILDKD